MTATPVKKNHYHLRVSIAHQLLEVFKKNNPSPIIQYPISSSRFGLGSVEGSFCTPLGNFVIEKKIGEDAPERMIFKAREPIGKIANLGGEEDLILSRILWLRGLEPHNKNTYDRFVYFHGTNQEALIGTPASHGCIRLRNADIIDLFNLISEGDSVKIVKI